MASITAMTWPRAIAKPSCNAPPSPPGREPRSRCNRRSRAPRAGTRTGPPRGCCRPSRRRRRVPAPCQPLQGGAQANRQDPTFGASLRVGTTTDNAQRPWSTWSVSVHGRWGCKPMSLYSSWSSSVVARQALCVAQDFRIAWAQERAGRITVPGRRSPLLAKAPCRAHDEKQPGGPGGDVGEVSPLRV